MHQIKNSVLGFKMDGIPLINTIASRMIHPFMRLHLFFTQLVVRSIFKLIGEKVGKNLHSKRSKRFGKSIRRRYHIIWLYHSMRGIPPKALMILIGLLKIWVNLLGQQVKMNMMTIIQSLHMRFVRAL